MLETKTVGTDALGVLETAALLRELTASLLTSADLPTALDRLVSVSRAAISGVRWCDFTVLRAGEPASTAVSDERLTELDQLRYGADAPAMSAIHQRDMVLVEDLRTERRWPGWTRRALAFGVRGVLCTPVDVDEQMLGSINLYAVRPGVLTADRQLTAMLIAEHAGLLLAEVRNRAERVALAGELDETLSRGEAIGQALAVIMTQRGCSAPDALQVLHTAAEALSIPLREVAERLVASAARSRPS